MLQIEMDLQEKYLLLFFEWIYLYWLVLSSPFTSIKYGLFT